MAQTPRPQSVPWVPLILTILAMGLFWALPALLGDRPLELTQAPAETRP